MNCSDFTPISPELLQYASPAEQRAYEAQLFRCMALASPLDYMLAVRAGAREYKHTRFISDKIAAAKPGDKLLFTLPPRAGKSYLLSEGVPAWAISKNPNTQVLHATYGHDFTVTFGRTIRRMIQDARRLGVSPRLDPSAKAVDMFFVHPDDGTGFYFGDGVGGGFTGRGGHVILLDDLIKNDEEAQSQIVRDKTWEWLTKVALTREEPLNDGDPGAIVVGCGTPWHEDDWIGRAKATGEWQHYNLAALAEEDDPLGREEGEALNPERHDKVFYLKVKERNPLAFSAMYQGHPTPEDGDVFQKSNLRYYEELPAQDKWGARFASVDLAHSQKQRADFSVVSVWMVTKPPWPKLYWIAMFRDKVTSGNHEDWIEGQLSIIEPGLRPRWILIGDKTFGSSLMDAAKKHPRPGMPLFKAVPENEDKWARAQPASALSKNGQLWLPKDAVWLAEAIPEMMIFNNGSHDDIVDTLAMAGQEFNTQPWVKQQKKEQPERTTAIKVHEQIVARQKHKHGGRLRKALMR